VDVGPLFSCATRLARAARFDRVGGAVGESQAKAMAATTSPITKGRMVLMTYSYRA